MPFRNTHKQRRALRAFVLAAMVALALAALPAHALPREHPAASRSFLSFLQDLRGWLVSLWGSEGMTVDPSGGQPGGSPGANATTTGDEGGSIDPHSF